MRDSLVQERSNSGPDASTIIVQQPKRRKVANVATAIVNRSGRRVVCRSKCSDDDKIRWIAYLGNDKFSCKHRFTDTYDFTYTETELKRSFYKWHLECCKANENVYLRVFEGNDNELMMYGQVTSVCYSEDGWLGKVRLKHTRLRINLTLRWMRHNFHDTYIQQWMSEPGKWKTIPPGCPKEKESRVYVDRPVLHVKKTKIKYPQGNLRNCMICSFASGLYYYGLKSEADTILRCAGDLYRTKEIFSSFHNIVAQACKGYNLVRSKKFTFFDQDEEMFDNLTLVILKENNGSCHHAVTVYKNMIFDASHDYILKRCRKTLDWSCAPSGYQNVYRSYTFMKERNQNKRQKIK